MLIVQVRRLRQRGPRSRSLERSRPRCEGRHERFWCRRLVSERRVGLIALWWRCSFRYDLGLAQSVEDLPIDQLSGRELMAWLLHLQQAARTANVVLLGILETVVDDFNKTEHRLQLQGSAPGANCPASLIRSLP